MPVINPSMVRTLSNRDPRIPSAPDVRSLVHQIRMKHPGGVTTALIGIASGNGFQSVRTPTGAIAMLIGMLLPAVQRVTKANGGELALLQSALKPGGTLGFVMADGSVREAQSGRTITDCEGYTSLSHELL